MTPISNPCKKKETLHDLASAIQFHQGKMEMILQQMKPYGYIHPEDGKRKYADPKCRYCRGKGLDDRNIPCDCENPLMKDYTHHVFIIQDIREEMVRLPESMHDMGFTKTAEILKQNGNEKAYRMGLEFARNLTGNRNWLLLTGPTRKGKTCLATAIMVYAYQNYGYPIQFWDTLSLIREFDILRVKNFSSQTDFENPCDEFLSEPEFMEKLIECPLLILDDLGVERKTDSSARKFIELIDGRFMNQKPIIITTNSTLPELAERYEDRTIRRITERTLQDKWIIVLED